MKGVKRLRKILIATHGYFADGIKSTVKLLTGKEECIQCIDAYVDAKDFTGDIQRFIDSINDDDEAVIFTDLYGGSVNQKVFMLLPKNKKIFLITGFNLPAVLEILLSDDKLTDEVVNRIIKCSREQMFKLPKDESEKSVQRGDDTDEEESFFNQD